MGCPSGIGPEIVAAALKLPKVRRALTPRVFGDASLESKLPRGALVVVSELPAKDRRPGRPTVASGRAQLAYVQRAIEAAKEGEVDALCTAPVSKEQISRAGVPFMGHTELLAGAFGRDVLMLMDGPRVRVALATNHVPLKEVSSRLSKSGLVAKLELLSRSLKSALGKKPRIAVCSLNPHAGEGGLLGKEELQVIGPAIADARRRGVDCRGPLAADGLFAQAERMPFDAVLAMFHDQGLVAAKALDFVRTVNVTLGLPVPRTSPDHGVAYDIAGKGKADCEPMAEALLKAAAFAQKRGQAAFR
jgi:4-hydroxythreonine-4-phosphate dehydrogenase